jgi:predicted Zn finger-like uncharacterized protein
MIISCPECRGRFRVDPSALGTDGRTVRCGKCAHSWLQAPPGPEAEPVGGDRADPAPDEVSPADAGNAADVDMETERNVEATSWDAPAAGDDEAVSARGRRRNRPAAATAARRWPAVVAWVGLVLVVGGLAAGLYVFRDSVMNTWPETAGLYDRLDLAQPGFGLVLAAPRAHQEKIDGKTALVVEGRIENPTNRERVVPKTLRLQLLDKDQQELQVQTFDSPARRLLPEQSVPYKIELKDPAEKRAVLLISFAEEKK